MNANAYTDFILDNFALVIIAPGFSPGGVFDRRNFLRIEFDAKISVEPINLHKRTGIESPIN